MKGCTGFESDFLLSLPFFSPLPAPPSPRSPHREPPLSCTTLHRCTWRAHGVGWAMVEWGWAAATHTATTWTGVTTVLRRFSCTVVDPSCTYGVRRGGRWGPVLLHRACARSGWGQGHTGLVSTIRAGSRLVGGRIVVPFDKSQREAAPPHTPTAALYVVQVPFPRYRRLTRHFHRLCATAQPPQRPSRRTSYVYKGWDAV